MFDANNKRNADRSRVGLTLLELVVVIAILAVLAGVVIPMTGHTSDDARTTATQTSLRELQKVILNQYMADMKGARLPADANGVSVSLDGLPRATNTDHPKLRYLYVDPNVGTTNAGFNSTTKLGWKGPYLMSGQATYPVSSSSFGSLYGTSGDSTVLDGWGNPIVIVYVQDASTGATSYVLLSAGAAGSLTFTETAGTPVSATVNAAAHTLTIGTTTYSLWVALQ